MKLKLDSKRALVTGASAGIGSAIAEVLAREGARVLVHGRNSGRIRDVVDRIASAGGKAVAIEGDLATDDGAAEVYSKAKVAFGGIDILINNAGAYEARSSTSPNGHSLARTRMHAREKSLKNFASCSSRRPRPPRPRRMPEAAVHRLAWKSTRENPRGLDAVSCGMADMPI